MSRFSRLVTVLVALCLALVFMMPSAEAQFGDFKKKVKKKIEKKAEEAVDEALEGKPEDKDTTKQEGTGQGKDTPKATEASLESSQKPGEGVWANYDFVPGSEVLFYDDFSGDPIGDFPMRLEYFKGNMEVAHWKDGNWARIPKGDATFEIHLADSLPERFTLETRMYLPKGASIRIYLRDPADITAEAAYGNCRNFYINVYEHWEEHYVEVHDKDQGKLTSEKQKLADGTLDLRIMMVKKYLKVYLNDTRVANIPRVAIHRSNVLCFFGNNNQEQEVGIMIGDIRVAEGGKVMLYEKLAADGRVATRGILFDSGSDRLRPESTPTLKQMGMMLQQYADLRLLIEGHTDNQGDDSFNQELSEKRAAAVKAFLVSEYQIDETRLESKGFGETKPSDNNATPEGRQNNRRVELVKL